VENAQQPGYVCTEVWFDELRLTDISEKGGWAAVGKVDVKLADLGTLSVAGSNKSAGWGTIDQNTSERSYENDMELDVATNLELGKLLPKKANLSVPIYAGVTRTVATPEYDPFQLDIPLKTEEALATSAKAKDSIRSEAIDAQTVTTINLTNLHVNNPTNKKLQPWSIQNFNISYSYTNTSHHSPLAVEDDNTTNKATFAYNYNHTAKFHEPFKKLIKSKSKWLGLIRDFNYNLMPSVLSFQANVVHQFAPYRSRNIGGPVDILPETFNNIFTFNRLYTLRWDFTRSLSLDYTATNNAWIDNDSGRLDKSMRRKVWTQFLKGGRTILFTQNVNVTYLAPTSKIPLLDWTIIKAGYSASYTWTTASQLAPTWGNGIANTQQRNLLADLDFGKLYDKWKVLKNLNAGMSSNSGTNGKPDTSRNKRAGAAATSDHGTSTDGYTEGAGQVADFLKAYYFQLYGQFDQQYLRLHGQHADIWHGFA
jgi:cell surface protein SprA